LFGGAQAPDRIVQELQAAIDEMVRIGQTGLSVVQSESAAYQPRQDGYGHACHRATCLGAVPDNLDTWTTAL
jgi:hypothetical protein